MRLIGLALGAAALLLTTQVSAGTLDQIRENGVLKIGYRVDAAPFSFKSAIGEPAGYSVDLCRVIATGLKEQLQLPEINVEYVPVGTDDRFEAVQQGRIDILCGATTATLSRRELVDFSLPVFVDGAGVLLRVNGPGNFEELAGQQVAVRGSTTTEEALRNTLSRFSIDAQLVPVDSHDEGLRRLVAGEVAAYFADRGILLFLALKSPSRSELNLSDRQFTYEPYALAVARGDTDFRLAVDRILSRVYRSGAIERVFTGSFGTAAKPTDLLKALYVINSLPE